MKRSGARRRKTDVKIGGQHNVENSHNQGAFLTSHSPFFVATNRQSLCCTTLSLNNLLRDNSLVTTRRLQLNNSSAATTLHLTY